jgi:hypothetical protein
MLAGCVLTEEEGSRGGNGRQRERLVAWAAAAAQHRAEQHLVRHIKPVGVRT